MIKIYIDKKKFFIKDSLNNLLQICLSLGLEIPYFCWHPELGSIGACRQCAVKIYKNSSDIHGTIVMSCMTLVQNEMRISIVDSETKKFRKGILELMMLNHPHDCPICAEGGSCHLQDMTVLNQHYIRRYRFEKRVFKNQFLGPLISHTMNRCITCYRCVRYYNDYAGGKDFGVYGSGNKIYFGRVEEGSLESEFSGNLIDVCPTGVFTDKTNKKNFYRKWDLQYTPSVCHHCSIGCNISIGEKLGTLCRIDNRYNKNINKHFLCDLGKFSYGFSNLNNRLKNPFQRINTTIQRINYSNAITKIADILKNSCSSILGIGSVRASLESNVALYNLVGKNNFSNGMLHESSQCAKLILEAIQNGGFYIPTISEMENYDVILIVGEDITQTAPRAALAVRQAIKNVKKNTIHKTQNDIPSWHSYAMQNISKNKKNLLFITSIDKTKLDDISTWNYYGSIKNQIKLVNGIAECIYNNFVNINNKYEKFLFKKIVLIAKSLIQAKKPLIISGASYLNDQILKSVINVTTRLKEKNFLVGLALFPPSVNSIGTILISGMSLNAALEKIKNDQIKTLIILENDLYRSMSYFKIKKILDQVTNIIVLDHYFNQTVNHANIFLPCTNFFESSGTVINYESRAQRFFRAFIPNFYNSDIFILDSWRWLYGVKEVVISSAIIEKFTLDNMIDLCLFLFPMFKTIKKVSPDSFFRIAGQKIARSSQRCSGRNASHQDQKINKSSVPLDQDTMFTFSMEGGSVQSIKENFTYLPFSWSPGWNSGQSYYKLEKSLQHKNFSFFTEDILYPKAINKNILYYTLENKNIKRKKKLSEFTVVPYYYLLYSEELSQQYFKRLSNNNYYYAIMNDHDACLFNLHDGDIIEFQFEMNVFNLPVYISKILESHLLGLPLGGMNIPTSIVGRIITDIRKKVT
ncbi:NADH-quinone oxidoreductase subunit NuoG [Buchnera aphidicola]|uniref:NADH-quinone oxidoreductase subunit NuoG n=1 Tax=Buchnera aphidicola TaxID=9 RepID=UPI00094CB4B6|nr:NADH-quinone oxidoreductase subunit NuoG [Buchnera aphidicola]